MLHERGHVREVQHVSQHSGAIGDVVNVIDLKANILKRAPESVGTLEAQQWRLRSDRRRMRFRRVPDHQRAEAHAGSDLRCAQG